MQHSKVNNNKAGINGFTTRPTQKSLPARPTCCPTRPNPRACGRLATDTQVIHERTLLVEASAAPLTPVRLLARVDADVLRQVVLPAELLSAVRAAVILRGRRVSPAPAPQRDGRPHQPRRHHALRGPLTHLPALGTRKPTFTLQNSLARIKTPSQVLKSSLM